MPSFPAEKLRQMPEKLDEQYNVVAEPGFDGRGMVKIRTKPDKPDLAYRLFMKSLGDDADHTRLKTSLIAVDHPAARRFLAYLFDGRKRRTPIETLAKMAGLGIPQLRDIWRQARLDEGLLALLNEYPRTMKDVALDARSTREMCKPCGGSGKLIDESRPALRNRNDVAVPFYIDCPPCNGKGWVRKPGDKDARQLMGQILGVSGKAAPLVNTSVTNITLESVINDIESMSKLMSRGQPQPGMYDVKAEALPEPLEEPAP